MEVAYKPLKKGVGMKKLFAAIFMLVFTLVFSQAYAADTLNGAGASFPYPVYSAWGYDYNKVSGVRLNYQSIGSGGGQRQITERTVDFGASDDPLKPAQLKKSGLLQFPAVIGGVVPVVNIKGVTDGQLTLTPDTLSGIFMGAIKYWDDPAIRTVNPRLSLPHSEIVVVYRSDGSGTTAIFTHYLSEVSNAWKKNVGEGKSVKYPVGIGAKGNEGVANYVKRARNSIGYVEFAYAKQNKLVYTRLLNRAGYYVHPDFTSFENAAETADFKASNHFHTWLTNAPGMNAWPIAGATFILLPKEKKDKNVSVTKFFSWAFSNGDDKARELAYVPLPKSLKAKVEKYWNKNIGH
jgi:phosphate transport system substrate-binding protein